MKANELMLGDLVLLYGEPIKATTMLLSMMVINEGSKAIQPIPITEEILKANGFENETADFWKLRVDDKPHHYSFRLDKDVVFCDGGYNMDCNIYTIIISYIHELQHALRLCGLNELADNFKLE